VARRPLLLNLHQDAVGIAIELNTLDALSVAAGLALSPKRFATAAVIASLTRLERFLVCGAIHPGHHQDATSAVVLSNDGQ